MKLSFVGRPQVTIVQLAIRPLEPACRPGSSAPTAVRNQPHNDAVLITQARWRLTSVHGELQTALFIMEGWLPRKFLQIHQESRGEISSGDSACIVATAIHSALFPSLDHEFLTRRCSHDVIMDMMPLVLEPPSMSLVQRLLLHWRESVQKSGSKGARRRQRRCWHWLEGHIVSNASEATQ